jgi:hypothetical protein
MCNYWIYLLFFTKEQDITTIHTWFVVIVYGMAGYSLFTSHHKTNFGVCVW